MVPTPAGEGPTDPAAPSARLLVLASRPLRNLEADSGYGAQTDPETGLVTLTHPKRFGRLERWFHRRLGGPEVLRRPLDRYGTHLWSLCNGKRSVGQIVRAMEEEFHEAIYPAAPRVQKLLEQMVRLGLVKLLPPDAQEIEGSGAEPKGAARTSTDEGPKTKE